MLKKEKDIGFEKDQWDIEYMKILDIKLSKLPTRLMDRYIGVPVEILEVKWDYWGIRFKVQHASEEARESWDIEFKVQQWAVKEKLQEMMEDQLSRSSPA